jgi:hypothetical protein
MRVLQYDTDSTVNNISLYMLSNNCCPSEHLSWEMSGISDIMVVNFMLTFLTGFRPEPNSNFHG